MKKLTLQEVIQLVEDTWGFVRNHRAMKSGDMWANSCLAQAVDWKEKLGLDETEQGLKKLKDIMADPTLSPNAKKAKTNSLKYELDPTDFKQPQLHRDITTSIVKGDMDTLANKLAELPQDKPTATTGTLPTTKNKSFAAPMSSINKPNKPKRF